MGILRLAWMFQRALFGSRSALADENTMLGQQLIVLQRSVPYLKFRRTERVVLCWLSRPNFASLGGNKCHVTSPASICRASSRSSS